MTPAAVGAQVRALEAWLGVTLFRRSKSGATRLILTDPALSALPELQEGFASISLAVRRMKRADQPVAVTLAVTSAFATHWLLNRLEGFRSQHPGLNIRLEVSDAPVDYERAGVDVGVRFGAGSWEGLTSKLLKDDRVFPVCSQAIFRDLAEREVLQGLSRHTLIHDTTVPKAAGVPTWREWLDANNARDITIETSLEVNATTSAIQAAIAGQGIVLGREMLVANDFSSQPAVQAI